MRIQFTTNAWEDYVDWVNTDKKVVKRINELIRVIQRTPFEGIGKPEPLRYDLAGFWSRRITLEHRLVYQIDQDTLVIVACKYHYDR